MNLFKRYFKVHEGLSRWFEIIRFETLLSFYFNGVGPLIDAFLFLLQGSYIRGECREGYVGNQSVGCHQHPGSCPDGTICDPNAECELRRGFLRYQCRVSKSGKNERNGCKNLCNVNSVVSENVELPQYIYLALSDLSLKCRIFLLSQKINLNKKIGKVI